MTNIIPFSFENNNIRTFIDGKGEVWFCGKDVATALGYEKPRNAIATYCRTPGALKQGVGVTTGKRPDGTDILQNVEMTFINEGNLYRLIMRSKLPSAEKFESWVVDEVLPTLRKTGSYSLVETPIERLMRNSTNQLETATALVEILKVEAKKQEALTTTIEVQKQQIVEMKPKADYYNTVLQSPDAVPITLIAKDYGKSAVWLNQYLKDKGIQFKKGELWLLYQKYSELGLTQSKTSTYVDKDGIAHTKMHTYWTQRGRLFIYNLLKEDGILPLIEQQ